MEQEEKTDQATLDEINAILPIETKKEKEYTWQPPYKFTGDENTPSKVICIECKQEVSKKDLAAPFKFSSKPPVCQSCFVNVYCKLRPCNPNRGIYGMLDWESLGEMLTDYSDEEENNE